MITFIANTGIQLYAFPLEIDTADGERRWFREHQDAETGDWMLEMMHAVKGAAGAGATDEEGIYLYEKSELIRGGYFAGGDGEIDIEDLRADGIQPVAEAGNFTDDEQAQFFEMHFGSRDSVLDSFENVWLPLPMFFRRGKNLFDFGPFDWVRLKLIPVKDDRGDAADAAPDAAPDAARAPRGREKGQKRRYTALLAVDTRTRYNGECGRHYEAPTFPDNYQGAIEFGLCRNELYVMDYCMPNRPWSYVDEYLRELVHPGVRNVAEMRLRRGARRLAYSATYIYLMNFLARTGLIPDIRIYKDRDVRAVDVDMVIDVGNSRTTALLVEDNRNFNQVSSLRLTDLTDPVAEKPREGSRGAFELTGYTEPFDMRLAFRRASFGDFGLRDTRQFVYPSLVRVGVEADRLVHRATGVDDPSAEPGTQRLTTYSSPKRYLWDGRPQTEEWRFVRLPGETGDTTLNLPGLTPYITSDGRATAKGDGGTTYHYSRRSLMTFAFLEMIVQARMFVNSVERRSVDRGLGHEEMPRRIRRIIVTCPTAMSKLERDALVKCADDAVTMLAGFDTDPDDNAAPPRRIEVIPHRAGGYSDEDDPWFYDEATCSQLVYIYGEAGHKYKGCASEFFRLYGKEDPATGRHTLTIGSLDIGAGTSDLMISRYDCEAGDVTTLSPEPQFYDSFYFAGDDMLHGLIKNYMLLSETGAFREALGSLDSRAYRQLMKDFFGPDYSGQTVGDRRLRRDFNMQYSVPLMYRMLELLNTGSDDCAVTYDEVFAANPPAQTVIDGFKARTGIDVTTLRWRFDRALMSKMVRGEFEPLLKKVSTIMYAHACDLVLLSGRPASLPVIRDIFLDYYTIEPNRLIVLNNCYVGDWYPFSNNTGYITNPKTIVAMGAVIAHYASELSNLNRFVINIEGLKRNLHSTADYIEASREGQPVEYFITPQSPSGQLTVSRVPTSLRIRQLGMDSYPSRVLYTVDFNRFKIADRVRRVAFQQHGETLNDAQVMARVQDEVDRLKCRMPFSLEIERNADNPETLDIVAITDRNGNPVSDSNLEIHVQSLGADEDYWLDTGSFEF